MPGQQQQQQPGGGDAIDGEQDTTTSSCCPRVVRNRRIQAASQEQELRGRALRRRQREKALLGHLMALQSEVQLAALKSQHKVSRCVSELASASRDRGNGWQSKGGQPNLLIIMLHRENDTLGFNITGGHHSQDDQLESTEGIYISKILVNGPADKTDGLQINDKIIQVNGMSKELMNSKAFFDPTIA
ncbi:PDZ domain-containing RING finger protein 4-like [Sphaerodactylus townsendi]|uniref:PDZ domain-containing RING finger protein 4-like n=1 Tax=Sphaerodactylus townsendi TaxID=933632 RepID=UPI0020268DDA|nr:PDZ domain-containing RING finger protein 4-like [Sphaerodactylus townsendi]